MRNNRKIVSKNNKKKVSFFGNIYAKIANFVSREDQNPKVVEKKVVAPKKKVINKKKSNKVEAGKKGSGSKAGTNIEKEKKYPLKSKEEYDRIVNNINSLTTKGFEVGADEPRDRVWKYIDTDSKDFYQRGISFSLRDRVRDRFVTIKIPVGKDERKEYEFSFGDTPLDKITIKDILENIYAMANELEAADGKMKPEEATELLKYFVDNKIDLESLDFQVTYISSSHRINVKNSKYPNGKVAVAVDNFTPIWSKATGNIAKKDQKTIYEIEIEHKKDKKKLKAIEDKAEADRLLKKMMAEGDKLRIEIVQNLPADIKPAGEAEANKYKRAINQVEGVVDKSKVEIGVGETESFSLRVSTAVLTQTSFIDPDTGELMLVLERKASYKEKDGKMKENFQAKPLGGASVLKKPNELSALIGSYNYDSEKSQAAGDFRLQIRPSAWEAVKQFCLKHFKDPSTGVLEADADRELKEEFEDSLSIKVSSKSFEITTLGAQVQSEPQKTKRLEVAGNQTVRVFNIQHVNITDKKLIALIKKNAETSNEEIKNKALAKAKEKGKGKASALGLISYKKLMAEYKKADSKEENPVVSIDGLQVADSVTIALRDNSELEKQLSGNKVEEKAKKVIASKDKVKGNEKQVRFEKRYNISASQYLDLMKVFSSVKLIDKEMTSEKSGTRSRHWIYFDTKNIALFKDGDLISVRERDDDFCFTVNFKVKDVKKGRYNDIKYSISVPKNKVGELSDLTFDKARELIDEYKTEDFMLDEIINNAVADATIEKVVDYQMTTSRIYVYYKGEKIIVSLDKVATKDSYIFYEINIESKQDNALIREGMKKIANYVEKTGGKQLRNSSKFRRAVRKN